MSRRIEQPRLSVVMATRDRPELVRKAVESALAQDFSDFELLLVDDASRPDAARALDRLVAQLEARGVAIRLLRNPVNLGPADARNRAIAEARAPLVAVMDDDDISLPNRFSTQVALLDARPEIEAVFSTVRWVDGEGRDLGLWPGIVARGALPAGPGSANALFRLLCTEGNKLPNPTLVARTELMRRFPYPSDLRVGEDWFVFLQWAASGVGVVGLADPLVDMRRGDDHQSLMANKRRAFADQRRVLRRIRHWCSEAGHPFPGSLWRRAASNQRVIEGRWYSGLRGLGAIATAIAIDPANARARKALGELGRKAVGKVGRLLRSPRALC